MIYCIKIKENMQLFIQKRGAYLGIDEGLFKVRVQNELQKLPVSKVKSIVMHQSATISTDAIFTAIENGIEIVFMDKIGKSKGRIWSHKFGSISKIRKNQIQFSQSEEGAKWIINTILTKIKNQKAILLTLGFPDDSTKNIIDESIDKLDNILEKIQKLSANNIGEIANKLRGYEGNASREYFSCMSFHLPPEYQFDKRSKHPAFDMFNSLLNYAYGILYSKIENALILAGIDPYLGIMHRDDFNKPVFVYDFIESYRNWADYVVIHLCMQQVIFIEFFKIENDVYYLNDQGKRILVQAFNDYFESVIKRKGIDRSRLEHIKIDAQKMATMLQNYKPKTKKI